MIDADKLREFVREHAEEISKHFFPAGHREGSEWRIGDVTGKSGSSLGIELKGPKAGLCHDRAGGFSGDLVKLIAENRHLTFPQTVEELERAFGVSFRLPQRFDWQPFVSAVTKKNLAELSRWRGFH